MSRDLEEGELRESPVVAADVPQRKKRRLENSMSPFIDTDDGLLAISNLLSKLIPYIISVSSIVDDITKYATLMLLSKKPFLTQEEGTYERIKLIGQGTFGEVYQACRLSDGVMVALKKIRMEEHNNVRSSVVICYSDSVETLISKILWEILGSRYEIWFHRIREVSLILLFLVPNHSDPGVSNSETTEASSHPWTGRYVLQGL